MKPVEFDTNAFEDLAWWILVGCHSRRDRPLLQPFYLYPAAMHQWRGVGYWGSRDGWGVHCGTGISGLRAWV